MYEKDPMIEEIHKIRREMWDDSGYNLKILIINIQNEAREFIEKSSYIYSDTEDGYRRISRNTENETDLALNI